jgi:hypothetical protein
LQASTPVFALAFSPDGRILATGSRDNNAQFWDLRSGKLLASPPPQQRSAFVLAVAFSPDGQTLATGSVDHTLQFWSARSGEPLAPPSRLQSLVWTVAFSPDRKVFFAATDHWLNTYSWDGKKAVLQGSQLLHGFWRQGFRFPSGCEGCLQVALGDTSDSFHLETLHLGEPVDPPLEGDPEKLLEKWQARLGLAFDEQMRPVQW